MGKNTFRECFLNVLKAELHSDIHTHMTEVNQVRGIICVGSLGSPGETFLMLDRVLQAFEQRNDLAPDPRNVKSSDARLRKSCRCEIGKQISKSGREVYFGREFVT